MSIFTFYNQKFENFITNLLDFDSCLGSELSRDDMKLPNQNLKGKGPKAKFQVGMHLLYYQSIKRFSASDIQKFENFTQNLNFNKPFPHICAGKK